MRNSPRFPIHLHHLLLRIDLTKYTLGWCGRVKVQFHFNESLHLSMRYIAKLNYMRSFASMLSPRHSMINSAHIIKLSEWVSEWDEQLSLDEEVIFVAIIFLGQIQIVLLTFGKKASEAWRSYLIRHQRVYVDFTSKTAHSTPTFNRHGN
jgi:hypothetical protein